MARELQAQTYQTSGTVYARLWSATGQYWYTVTPAFETYNAAHITSYALTGTQDGSNGKWTADMPAAVTVGLYYYCFFLRAGGSPAEADLAISTVGSIEYTGTVASAAVAYLPQAQAGAANGVPTVDANNNIHGLVPGTGTGQINANSGKVPATLASTDVTGNVACDLQTIKTQAVTCAAGVTVNTNVGTTQPVNFTGTASSALVQTDIRDWNGAAVATPNVSGVPKVDVVDWLGTAPNSLNAGRVDAACSVRSGTAQTGSASTITLDSGASSTNNLYQDALVFITGGTGAGQVRSIISYVGSTKVASIYPNWTTNPDLTSTFTLLPMGQVDVGCWNNHSVSSTISGIPDVNLTTWLGSTPNSLNIGKVDAVCAIRTGTCQAGSTSTTIIFDSGASTVNDLYKDCLVLLAFGPGIGQVASIQSYTGSTRTATIFPAWQSTPTASTQFIIIPMSQVDVGNWLNVAPLALSSQQVQAVVPSSTVVASVTGAVGSVTGNVGGSVGSVVSSVTVGAYSSGQDPFTLIMAGTMTEAYSTGAVTLPQAIYEMLQVVGQFSISGTTLTVQKRDKTTTAATFTLDSADDPTSRSRAS
jgi:hypothetical protein